jgi:hypothetical protein
VGLARPDRGSVVLGDEDITALKPVDRATLVAFYAQAVYGQFTAPVFLALVFAYMFKDRIKEFGDDWVKPGKIVSNGAYVLEDWRINERIRLRKNSNYWNSKKVALESVEALPISTATVAFNFYAGGLADLIKRIGSGLYTWMPLGLRILRKVENIVREEMNRAGALELLMPGVIPAELWVESGRWGEFGPELLRLKDRHERNFCLGPTHEEVITDIARNDLKSYRQLPANFYQIQMKFRDERRPRFGVMRAREFLMKDAYSFDLDDDGLKASYAAHRDAYERSQRVIRERRERGDGRRGRALRPHHGKRRVVLGASAAPAHALGAGGVCERQSGNCTGFLCRCDWNLRPTS